ncbi:GAF domain-containing protein (plasmid) [Skermanella sp. TT6]|uniref:histidine kinase n=1 Tax=Skermanella cutis TaxID=2775420 RepID=A0ABX7BF73_9PROT|nr:GAF domain-containing protein [Skermanella sp. TT6]QQP93044.1 GAF domain-containing protein [Skermanella sp. TT6]
MQTGDTEGGRDMGDRRSEFLGSLPDGLARPPVPLDEPQRLIALNRYDLLDTPPERAFDHITRLAARVLGTPISLVTLIDENRQWFKSRYGLDAPWTRRELAFCSYTILDTETLVVPDAMADDRFAANPLVTGDPNIRFYAGAPLVTPEGHALGTLCVIDRSPHPEFGGEQRRLLRDFADLVMTEIEARSAALALRRKVREHQETERQRQRSLAEKETLLREVHHRVKNNLQVVDALLALQIRHTPVIAENLRELRCRVYSLGLVHQELMQSGDLETINPGEFLRDLTRTLAIHHAAPGSGPTLDVAVESGNAAIRIDLAIPLGLLVTELVSDAYKHAFAPDRHGAIGVSLTFTGGGKARLIVSDDGSALPDTVSPSAIGQRIVTELVDQLDGDVAKDEAHGTRIIVTFPCLTEPSC